MNDLAWLSGLARWAGQHSVVLCLIVALAACVGFFVGAILHAAPDPDDAPEQALVAGAKRMQGERAGRVWSNVPPPPQDPDEHETHLGAA